MGCQLSTAGSQRPGAGGSYNGTPTTDGPEEAEATERPLDDVQLKRLQFFRSASSSTSSLNAGVMKAGSKRRKKGKKRPYSQLNSKLPTTTFDGGEISLSILGDLPKIVEVNEALEKLAKEDTIVEPLGRPNPPLSPTISHRGMSRFLHRKSKNEESLSEVSQTDDPQPFFQPTHRRQQSNENFFQRLQAGGLSGLATHRRQTSLDVNLAKADVQISGEKGTLTTNASSGSVGSTGVPISMSGGGHHRRQNSESKMFSRIVRVSSLAAMASAAGSQSTDVSEPISDVPPTCSTKTFRSFLEKENREAPIVEELEMWRQKVLGIQPDERWTISHMRNYLLSAANQAKDLKELALPLDMTRPITEYFASTSHNTYLSGGQWVTTGGKVDSNMYIRAIKQGCRCVEIDIYDGPDGDPIVTHVSSAWSGGSATFLEVCAIIAKEAFKETRSPLILNLENNMNKQSKRAAEILMGAFGSRIVRVDDADFGWKSGNRYVCPTPADLTGRVLCRSKPRDSCEEFQNLIYLRNSHWRFGNMDEIIRRKFYQTSSLSESKVKGAVRRMAVDIMPYELHRVFINRVYPRASAYSSQNYNPVPYWLLGFQLVALNFQTEGVDMDVNRCMFERNSGQGWVLKPPLLRRSMPKPLSKLVGGRVSSSRGYQLISASKGSKAHLIQSSGGDQSPSGQQNRSFFGQPSKLFAGIVGSKEPSGAAALTASPSQISATLPSTLPPLRSVSLNGSQTILPTEGSTSLRRTEHNKSFMGVVEEALKNQNDEDEEDLNDEDDDLPPPPPTRAVTDGALLLNRRLLPTVEERSVGSDLAIVKRPQSALGRTLSSQSSDIQTDSPDVPAKVVAVTDLDKELSLPGASPALLPQRLAVLDEEHELKRRGRNRRRSTGSIANPPLEAEASLGSRKRSLESIGGSSHDLLARSPTGPPPMNVFEAYEEPVTEDKVTMMSALIQFISVRCSVSRERMMTPPIPVGTLTKSVSESTPKNTRNNSATSGFRFQKASSAIESQNSFSHLSKSLADDMLDEEVYIEVLIDGHHQMDRVEKRTTGTVMLKGTEPCEFQDREEVATIFKDSETALVTIRLIDAWDGGSAREVIASRTFFAHCLLPGTRDLILLGEGSNAGFPIPYTVRCRISPLYSVYSKSKGRYELEDKVELPVLSCPSKLTMIHCVVIACRAQTNKLKLEQLDPFVSLQVIGVPSDCRETRTPRISRCASANNGKSTMAAPGRAGTGLHSAASSTASASGPKTSSLLLANLVDHPQPTSIPSNSGSSSSLFVSGDAPECTWMFPLVTTFAWSEFAFLRFTLRSNSNVDIDTGSILGPSGGSSTRRRGSLSFLSGSNAHQGHAGSSSGQSMAGSTPSHSNHGAANFGLDNNGFVLGKTMLWADAIRPGYRSVALYSEKNPDMQVATLLCHFTLFNAREQTFGPILDDVPLIKMPQPPPAGVDSASPAVPNL